ncbi:MAG TPA: Yip1 family protein [Steroidobacteraceae bacterium]|nr:Yip1 family protein [Steroidobacteraceae bacterium]
MSNLVARVQNILMTPKTEWPVIAAEPETTSGLYTKYILIVSAVAAIAMFVKASLIGTSTFIGTYRMDVGAGIGYAVTMYVAGLVGIYLWSLIINALAPTFGGQKDSVQALKTAAYAATAAWVGSIGQLVPWLGWLIGIAAGIYSIYLLYLGLPHTMKAPADRAAGYTAVAIIVAIVLSWILWAIIGSIAGRGLWGGPAVTVSDSGFEEGSSGAALEKWAKEMEKAGKQMEASANQNAGAPSAAAIGSFVGAIVGGGESVPALPVDQIKTFLPETLAGLPRTSMSAERNAAMGFEVSEASADYGDGAGRSLRLEINDTGGAKGLLAFASWANVEEEREWDGGYERNYRADGRMVHERWDANSKRGEYTVIVANRFALEIEGEAASMDELKSALAAGVNVAGLEAAAAAQPKPPG